MLFKLVDKFYKKMLYARADDNGAVFYFSSDDFEGLNKKSYSFPSSDGHTLQGYFYYYDNYIENRIIIFEHGMGSGHRGYMKEIEMLAKHGYLVFSYDHTGCMESGGETTGGFAQSLKDLNDAINALKKHSEYQNYDISVVGHSWGGFSTLNICALQPDIKHIVAISGFVSVDNILKQFFAGPLSYFYKKIYQNEKIANPDLIESNAIDALKNSDVKALIIHSDDDKTVSCTAHFDLLAKELSGKKNINFLKLTGKNHNPNYTAQAVKYKDEFFATYSKALRKKQLVTEQQKKEFIARFDWNKMTEQDTEVWNYIFEHLDNS